MKPHSTTLRLIFTIAFISAIATIGANAEADIVVVDPTDDATVTTSHLAGDVVLVNVIAADIFARLDVVGGTFGVGAGGLAFSSGSDITVLTDDTSVVYLSTTFQSGAGTGINYVRMDMNFDSVFETVLEVDLGVETTTADDFITRYAYDDGFSDLNVSDAVNAFTGVPEPGTGVVMVAIGLLAAARRVRRR